MLFLALPSLRARWVSFIGVLVTVAAAVTLMTGTGALLEAGVRGAVPPERLGGATIVVAGDQSITEVRGSGEDRETVRGDATERVRLPSHMASRIASIAGVEAVMSERSLPGLVDRRRRHATQRSGGRPVARALVGAAPRSHRSRSHRGVRPTNDHEIVLDAALGRTRRAGGW